MTKQEFFARFKACNDKLSAAIKRVRKIPNYNKSTACTDFIASASLTLTRNVTDYGQLVKYPEQLKSINMEAYIDDLEGELRIYEIKCKTLVERPPIYVPYDPNDPRRRPC